MNIQKINSDHWQQWKIFRLQALQQSPEAFGGSFKEESLYSKEKWQDIMTPIN